MSQVAVFEDPGRHAPDHSGANWQDGVFDRFRSDLEGGHGPFPCTFGVAALKRGGLRYAFVEEARDPLALLGLRTELAEYMASYRALGRLTSFVAFFRPPPVERPIATFERDFWEVLQYLRDSDPGSRPREIPIDSEDPHWEFTFAGEPVFVVCNTPAHQRRRSRRSPGMLMTFQPRWVFEGLEGHTPKGQRAREVIRERLAAYDDVPAHPELGNYGEPGNREWAQYFLPDDNEAAPARCPLHDAHAGKETKEELTDAA